jgi:hypothetical protein
MKKLVYTITEGNQSYDMVFITDRTPQWTEEQYMRHRNCVMTLIGEEQTNETESKSYKL